MKLKQLLNKKFVKDIASTSVTSIITRAFGLLVPVLIARFFGANKETDEFFFVYSFIMFITMIFSTSLEQSLIPFIVEKKHEVEKSRRFLGQIFASMFIVSLVFGITGYFFLEPLFSVFTHFPKESFATLKIYFLETLPMGLFVLWNSTLVSNLNSNSKFISAASSPIVRSLTTIIIILSFHKNFGIYSIPLGYSIGEGLRFIFLVFITHNHKIQNINFVFNIDKEFLNFFKVLSYQMISLIAVGINPFIDRTMATWANVGGVSILEYSEKIYLIPMLLLTSGIFSVLLPRWSNIRFVNNFDLLKKELGKMLIYLLILSIIITTPIILLTKNIVNILYGSGIHDINILKLISLSTIVYLISVPPYVMSQAVVRGLLALKLTKQIMLVAIIKSILNVVLNFIFLQIWGIVGIVFSTSLGSLLILFTLLYFFRTNIRTKIKYDVKQTSKVVT